MMVEELREYFIPALRTLGLPLTIIGGYKLDKLLNVDWYKGYQSTFDVHLSEDAKKLLQQLAGPHGKAILEAYRAKHGLRRSYDDV